MEQQQKNLDPRVRIALDALGQLEAKRIQAMHLVYVAPSGIVDRWSGEDAWSQFVSYSPGQTDLREIFRAEPCKVCALGALFCAKVEAVNNAYTTTMERPGDEKFIRQYLSDEFPQDQLSLIELAFEGPRFVDQFKDSQHPSDSLTWRLNDDEDFRWSSNGYVAEYDDSPGKDWMEVPALTRAVKFHFKGQSAEERMRLILQNIVENGGTFVP